MAKLNSSNPKESETNVPRALAALQAAEELLFYQVWFNRHQNRCCAIQEGRAKIVDADADSRELAETETIHRDVWERAVQNAQDVLKRYGAENFGPWDDFEWGMLNGKLSAIRWALGDEWDMLDT